MPSPRIIIILALLASAAAVAGSVRPPADLTASALPVPDPSPVFTYVDDLYGFSFENAAALSLALEHDPSVGQVLFGDAPDGSLALFVRVSPYTAGQELTAELIRDNLDQREIESAIEQVSLDAGVTAFSFQRPDTPWGQSRDAIFVWRGMEYHVSVPAERDTLLLHVLETWRFPN